jgi:ankyrin repeat protein
MKGTEKSMKKEIKMIMLSALFLGAFSLFGDIGLYAGMGRTSLEKAGTKYYNEPSKINIKNFINAIEKATTDDLNKKYGENEQTPLHIAANRGHKDIVETLIKKKVNFNVQDKNDMTPLHHAVGRKKKDVVELLIKAKANLDMVDIDGWTPLYFAVIRKKIAIVKALIEAKADLNVKGKKEGHTPLHYAASRGYADIVKLLLEAGADPNVVNKFNYRPILYAKVGSEIEQLLKDAEKQSPVTPKVEPSPTERKPTKFVPLELLKEHKWKIGGVLVGTAIVGSLSYWIYRLLKRKQKVTTLVKRLKQVRDQAESPEEYNRLKNQILRGVDPAIKKQVEQ